MKQTAVQWLVEQLENHNGVTRPAFENVIQQTKAMEKEQIIEAVESTIKSVELTEDKTAFFAMGGEGYYTETYESKTNL